MNWRTQTGTATITYFSGPIYAASLMRWAKALQWKRKGLRRKHDAKWRHTRYQPPKRRSPLAVGNLPECSTPIQNVLVTLIHEEEE